MTSLIDPKNPGRWLDGSFRSQANGFCQGHTGIPINWAKATERAAAGAKITASIERQRAKGIDASTLYGLSAKSDETLRKRKYSPPIEGREAGRKSAEKREAISRGGI